MCRRLIVQQERRTRQVVKQRLKSFVEEREPVFDTGMFLSRTHRFIEWVVRSSRAELQPIILAKTSNGRFIQYDFADGRQFNEFQLFGRALRRRVKPPGAVQIITKEIQPNGAGVTRRIDVDDAAPNGIVTGLCHRGGLDKPHPHQKGTQGGLVDAVADPRGERCIAKHVA